jgi:hypothetical protein
MSHATELRTRRTVTGPSFCLPGVAIAFKSKLQPTVATSSTESKLKVPSILIELGLPPFVPTLRTVVTNQRSKLLCTFATIASSRTIPGQARSLNVGVMQI